MLSNSAFKNICANGKKSIENERMLQTALIKYWRRENVANPIDRERVIEEEKCS